MDRSITIIHQASSNPREICRLPVRYQIEEDLIINAPIVYCAIDIPREHIPVWLNPVPLETTYFCEDGMHMVVYNTGDITGRDAREFFAKVYLAIMQAENSKAVAEEHTMKDARFLFA